MNEALTSHLKQILDRTDTWLRYGETKNAALAALSGAVIVAITRVLASSSGCLHPWLQGYLVLVLLGFFVAVLLAIASFAPSTDLPFLEPRPDTSLADNLWFFGHIAKYGSREYVMALSQALRMPKEEPTEETLHLAEQIVINSRITVFKLRIFTLAWWAIVMAVATPVFGLLILVLFSQIKRSEGVR